MQDSFDVLEEKVKKAAELVKKLRKENKTLDEQLKDHKARLAEAEKKLAALEAQIGDAAGDGIADCEVVEVGSVGPVVISDRQVYAGGEMQLISCVISE